MKQVRPALYLLGLVALVYGLAYWQGGRHTREKMEAGQADSVATIKAAVTDSVMQETRAALDSAANERTRIVAQKDAEVRTARGATDRALARLRVLTVGNTSQVPTIANTLLDTAPDSLAADIDGVRYFRILNAVDSLNSAIELERAAHDSAVKARDDEHRKELQLVRLGMDQLRSTLADEREAVQRQIRTAVTLARGAGIRRGRIEGAVVVVAGFTAILAVLK